MQPRGVTLPNCQAISGGSRTRVFQPRHGPLLDSGPRPQDRFFDVLFVFATGFRFTIAGQSGSTMIVRTELLSKRLSARSIHSGILTALLQNILTQVRFRTSSRQSGE